MKPVVSVLLPVYNGEVYLKPAIESVLNQTFGDWELFIGDNASTDGTRAIIESYRDPRIRVHRHATNIGLAPNWNFLLQNARGDYACVLGADDVFEPNHLERKVNLLQKFPDSPFIHGTVQIMDEHGTKTKIYEQNVPFEESRGAFLHRMLRGNPVNAHTTVFRLHEAKSIGFNTHYTFLLDWCFWMEFALNTSGMILYDNLITMKYRMHPQNTTNLQIKSFRWLIEGVNLQLQMLNEYANTFRNLGIDPEAEENRLTDNLWALAFQQARHGKWDEARQVWKIYRQYHGVFEMLRNVPSHYWKRLLAK